MRTQTGDPKACFPHLHQLPPKRYLYVESFVTELNETLCHVKLSFKIVLSLFFKAIFPPVPSQDTNIIQVLQRSIACTLQTISGIASG